VISRLRYSIMCALLLSSAIAVAGEPVKPETPFEKAKRLAVSKEKKNRIQALRWLKALAKPGTTSGDEATFRYAELCLRFHSEGERGALEQARTSFENLRKNSGSRYGLRGLLGKYRCLAAHGKRDEAIAGFDAFLKKGTRCERAIEAGYYLGSIRAERFKEIDELRSAVKALSYSLKLYAAIGKYNKPIVPAKVIKAKLAWVKRKIWELEAGKLKVLFEKAEKLRKAKKFDAAIKVYRQICKQFPGHDLMHLSGLRVAQCCFWKGKLREAVSEAKVFVAEDPLGPYRGQGHLLIGDIFLEHQFDIRNSEPEYGCVLDPAKKRPQWLRIAHRAVLSRRRGEKSPMPLTRSAGRSWDKVRHHAHERLGIVQYVRRDFKKAAEHFGKSAALKPDTTFGHGVPAGMALLAEKCRKREDIVPAFLLGGRNERAALALVMASIYYEGWKYEKARTLYLRVGERDLAKEASLHQRAFALLRMGACYSLEKNDVEKAKSYYSKLTGKPYNKSVFTAEALNQWACLLLRTGNTKKAAQLLEKAYTQYPNQPRASTALFNRAFAAYCTEGREKALPYYSLYLSRYPGGPGAERARRMIKRIHREVKEKKDRSSKDKGN
jgi:outer membrane protein assembly factor BamD (BamD/ComL family)